MTNTSFYTNVQSLGNNILFRGVLKGKRVKKKIAYCPSLYISTNSKNTEFTSLDGKNLNKKTFDSIRDARDYLKQFEDVQNSTVYGNSSFEYAYIAENYKGIVDWDKTKTLVASLDIEVGSENGFPEPSLANEQITAIGIKYFNSKMIVFGCGDYVTKGEEVYFKCDDEYDLCMRFLEVWGNNCPDVVTGWNTKYFDIPYLVNRFRKIVGEEETKRLSPWGHISERNKLINNKQLTEYILTGVSSLDYIELYKSYAKGGRSQESYKLDNIANVELGESKLSYDEYDNLHQLYRLNYQKFIEYNIKDVELIVKLDEKLKLIDLAMTLAYNTKTNYDDVFTQTRMCDAMSYSYLLARNIIVPPKVKNEKTEAFEGAYVKEVQVGLHDYIASFDLDSLHPHLIMQYNLSPETIVDPKDYDDNMRRIVSEGVTVEKLLNKSIDLSGLKDVTLAANGQFFRTDKQGFLPAMLEEMYADRKKYKKIMLQYAQQYENETDPIKKQELENDVIKYDNIQLAKKLGMNSVYGALGSQYFRFYDLRLALAVTLSSQLSIRWIANRLNSHMNKILKTDNKDFIIASDTDSVYLRLGELVKRVYGANGVVQASVLKIIDFMDRVCERDIKPVIDESFQELADYTHAYQQKMQMKREALADKGIWTAKKRYILNVYNNEGVAYKEPYIKVIGLEVVKSSTPSVIRVKMKQIIKLMMQGTEVDIHNFIKTFRDEFRKLPSEDISFPRGVNGLGKYEDALTIYKSGTPIHVKGAILYNNFLKNNNLDKKYPLIQEGEKLKFTYLKKQNHFKETVISFPTRLPKEFGLDDFIDYDMQFEKAFVEPIRTILDCIGWTTEKVSTLDDFFN